MYFIYKRSTVAYTEVSAFKRDSVPLIFLRVGVNTQTFLLTLFSRQIPSPTTHTVHALQEEGVWTSLSAVVTAVVDCELTASSFIEGMWMCRQQQLPDDQQQVRV